MLEAMGKRMGEVGARIANADAETLWADIQRMAIGEPWSEQDPFKINTNVLAAHIIRIAEIEHWTLLHTAMVLAYTHMVLASDHATDLKEMLDFTQRPIIVNRHCANCLCEDKK
jgi:hypothetical protein